MSYYTYILAKYDFSDCKTFEDVKSKFPDSSPAFLRKVIYLKGLKTTEEGKLREQSKEPTLVQQGPSNHRRSERPLGGELSNKQPQYPKVNCPQCGKEIFLVYPNDPFCSKKCKKEFRITHIRATKVKEKVTSEDSLKNNRCPECWSDKLVWNNEYSKIMCIDCGFVGRRTSFITKELEE